jgi:hypothetical protein
VDCIEDTAAASACTACGQELYTLTTDAAYGGTACMGSSTLCADGDGTAACTPAPCPAPLESGNCAEPFISQFQEAMSGNNKYAQLYNPSDAAISLDEYTWVNCANGCGDGDGTFEYVWSFPVGATIPVGGTWTWCNSQMEAETLCTDAGADPATCCDLAEPYPVASWNGDDAQGLIKGAFADKDAATAAYAACPALLVDQVGSFSEADPGSFWPICGSVNMDTRNGRMFRMADTCVGSGSSDAEFLADFSGECSWGEDEGHVETGVTAWPPAPGPQTPARLRN